MSATVDSAPRTRWCLECFEDDGTSVRRVPIRHLPFRIGRRLGLDLILPSASVSKEHAEIYEDSDALYLRDLGSTNGTFVNHKRIQGAPLQEGDIIHFAKFEFRLGRQLWTDDLERPINENEHTVSLRQIDLSHHFVEGTRQLGELLRDRRVRPLFQPVVSLEDGSLAAYEILGRGTHPSLPESPGELFRIAAGIAAEAQLSELFRTRALELVGNRAGLPPLFFNTHPAELERPELLESLAEQLRTMPKVHLILEVHEGALADLNSMKGLRGRLSELGVGLAYDDFGSGQARLIELAEVPPDFLKFDMRLVRNIDKASPSRLRVVTKLNEAARELKAKTVAEGIETQAEADTCIGVGFTHAQGHLFGYPVPLSQIEKK